MPLYDIPPDPPGSPSQQLVTQIGEIVEAALRRQTRTLEQMFMHSHANGPIGRHSRNRRSERLSNRTSFESKAETLRAAESERGSTTSAEDSPKQRPNGSRRRSVVSIVKAFATTRFARRSTKSVSIAPGWDSASVKSKESIDAEDEKRVSPSSELRTGKTFTTMDKERKDKSLMLTGSSLSLGSSDRRRTEASTRSLIGFGYSLLVLSHILWLGLDLEFIQMNSPGRMVAMFLYNAIFICELVYRIWHQGLTSLLSRRNPDRLWNWFDGVMVSVQSIAVLCMLISESASNLLLKRLALYLNLVPVFRFIRILRDRRGFRVLMMMLIGSLKPLAYSFLILLFIMYCFGIIFAAKLIDLRENDGEQWALTPNQDVLMFYFGSIPTAVFTLLKSIYGGVDWGQVVSPLFPVGSVWPGVFIAYIVFVQLAVMNVVASAFLQTAIENAQCDQDNVIQLKIYEKANYIERLGNFFEVLNTSGSGRITLREFDCQLKNEHMSALMQTLDIESDDAWTLFKLLDVDMAGSISKEQFINGCLHLRGNSKSIEMAQIMYHHNWIMDKLADMSLQTDELQQTLLVKQNHLEDMLKMVSEAGRFKKKTKVAVSERGESMEHPPSLDRPPSPCRGEYRAATLERPASPFRGDRTTGLNRPPSPFRGDRPPSPFRGERPPSPFRGERPPSPYRGESQEPGRSVSMGSKERALNPFYSNDRDRPPSPCRSPGTGSLTTTSDDHLVPSPFLGRRPLSASKERPPSPYGPSLGRPRSPFRAESTKKYDSFG